MWFVEWKEKDIVKRTVASLHWLHLTTCCSRLPEMSIMAWQTLQVTMGKPPWLADWNGGGNSSGPIGETVFTFDWTFTFGWISSARKWQVQVDDIWWEIFSSIMTTYYLPVISLV